MKKQTGYQKGLNELIFIAKATIQAIIENANCAYSKDTINGKELDTTETIDKLQMNKMILNELPKYLVHHYERTFNQIYNSRHSVMEGKKMVINKKTWNSFELTQEEKNNIFQDVFSIPYLLSNLFAERIGELKARIMVGSQKLGISRFINEDQTGKLAAYGQTKRSNPIEQQQIFPQVLVKYYSLYQTEDQATYRKLLGEKNYYSEKELDKAEGRFKKYVEKFIRTTLQILEKSSDTEKSAREKAIKRTFEELKYPNDIISPDIVKNLSRIIKDRLNKEKLKK